MAVTMKIVVSVLGRDKANIVTVTGRDAWALQCLHEAGTKGCTPIDTPGPRWSAYVLNLRRMGFAVETVHESHKGPFPGTHARYVLRDRIVLHTPSENGPEAA